MSAVRRWLAAVAVLVGTGRRSELPAAAALAIVVAVLAGAAVAGPRLVEEAEADSLRMAVDEAPAPRTRLTVAVADRVFHGTSNDPDGPVQTILAEATATLPPDVTEVYGDPRIVVDTPRFVVDTVDGETPESPTFITFRIQPGLEEHSRLVDGTPARPSSEIEDQDASDLPILEIEVSQETAEVLGLDVGSVLVVGADGDDPLARQIRGVIPGRIQVRIAGIRELDPPADPFWFGDPRLHRPIVSDTGVGADFFGMGSLRFDQFPSAPLFAGDAGAEGPLRMEERRDLDPVAITLDSSDRVLEGLTLLEASTSSSPGPGQPAVSTGLGQILEAEQGQRQVARSTLLLAAVGTLAVAMAALGQVVLAAASRRLPWNTVARVRGARSGDVVTAALTEVLVVSLLAALVGATVAALAVGGATTDDERTLVAILLAGTLVAALAASWPAAHQPITAIPDSPRRRGRLWRLSGVLLILLAIASVVQFRRRGVAVDTGAIDPLVLLVPVLVPLAVAQIVRWITPSVLARVSRRSLRLGVGTLVGVRRAAADPASGAGLVAVLALAVTVAGVGLGVDRSMVRGIDAASWRLVGAPARIDTRDPQLLASVGDVDGLSTAARGDGRISVSNEGDIAGLELVNIDTASYQAMTAGTPADLSLPAELGEPRGELVPVIAAARVGGHRIEVGDQLEALGGLNGVSFVVVEVRPSFDGDVNDWLVVDRAVLTDNSVTPPRFDTVFLDGDDEALDEAAAIASDDGAVLVDRADLASTQRDDPLARITRLAYLSAGLLSILLALLAAVGMAVVTARRRRREVAVLGLLGADRHETSAAVRAELLPPAVIGVLAGTVVGVGVVSLLDGRLDLAAFTGGGDLEIRAAWLAVVVLAIVVCGGVCAVLGAVVRRIARARADVLLREEGAA